MSTLPAQLESLFFTRLGVFANPDWDVTKYKNDPIQESVLDVTAVPGQEMTFACTQRMKHDGQSTNSPYTLDIECVAVVRFTEPMSEADQVRRAHMLGHNTLYASCREAVLSATGRQVWGPFLLGFGILTPTPKESQETKDA